MGAADIASEVVYFGSSVAAPDLRSPNQAIMNTPERSLLPKKPEQPKLADIVSRRLEADQSLTPAELLDITPDEIHSLSPNDYAKYLTAIGHIEPPEAGCKLIVKNIDVLVDRFEAEMKTVESLPPKQARFRRKISHEIGEQTASSLHRLAATDGMRLPQQALERLYGCIDSDNRLIRYYASEYMVSVIDLDVRNNASAESAHLLSRFTSDTVRKLISPKDAAEAETGDWMIDTAWAYMPGLFSDVMVNCVKTADDPSTMQRMLRSFANRIGLEETRGILRDQAAAHPDFASRLPLVDSALGIKNGSSFAELPDLYKEIIEDFAKYTPNKQVNDFEIGLILEYTEATGNVLDIGFGAGRLIIPLREKGLNVYGVDEVGGFTQYVKTHDPDSKIVQASWYKIPYKSKSFDTAYCLGRSYLHNTSVDKGIQFLEEAGRVLTDKGTLFIDLPKMDEGHYQAEMERAARSLDQAGMVNREQGFMHDSPDDIRYFDRLAVSDEQFKAQARLAGLEAEKFEEKTYTDDEGHTNTNVYWKLTKREKPLTLEEIFEAHAQAYTSGIPLEQFITRI